MRMIVTVTIPNEPFNQLVRQGTAGTVIQKAFEASKPQAVYFTDIDGQRSAIMIVDVKEPSSIPGIAEPWFVTLNAKCTFRIAMTPEDLAKSGIDQLGKTL